MNFALRGIKNIRVISGKKILLMRHFNKNTKVMT